MTSTSDVEDEEGISEDGCCLLLGVPAVHPARSRADNVRAISFFITFSSTLLEWNTILEYFYL